MSERVLQAVGLRLHGNTEGWALLLVGLAIGWLVLPTYWLGELTLMFVYVVAVLGTDLLVGRAGILSLCQASFIGVGAYVAAVGATDGLFVLWQVVLAVVMCVVFGVVLAIPALRMSGMRLAIVTLLFGTVFSWAIDMTTGTTGGAEGMSVPPLQVGPVNSLDPHGWYVTAAVIAVGATIFVWQLSRGQWGRRLVAVRDSELAARSVGVNVLSTKIGVVVVGACFCGVAGVVYAYTEGFVTPSSFDTFPSAYLLVGVLLGGAGTLSGAWLGAAYITLVPDVFALLGIPNLYALLGGFVLVIVTLMVPGGLTSVIVAAPRALRRVREYGSRPVVRS